MLTNWNTIQNSIKRLKKLDEQLSKENIGFTKKEILKFSKEKEKLQRSLGGIAEMKKTPDLIFIIDTNIESLAVAEAKKAVIAPKIVITDNTKGEYSKIGEQRANKKTPAVTIVAACSKAETGVGPSIASGSQVCKPICADLPITPINKKIQIKE